ncbi:unnamed protein product [Ixodes pacificus]
MEEAQPKSVDDDDCGSESAVDGTGGLGEGDQAQGVVDEGEAESTKSALPDSEMTEEEVSETYDTFDELLSGRIEGAVDAFMERLGGRLSELEVELRYAWRAVDLLSQEYVKMWEKLERLEILLYEQQAVIGQLMCVIQGGGAAREEDLPEDLVLQLERRLREETGVGPMSQQDVVRLRRTVLEAVPEVVSSQEEGTTEGSSSCDNEESDSASVFTASDYRRYRGAVGGVVSDLDLCELGRLSEDLGRASGLSRVDEEEDVGRCLAEPDEAPDVKDDRRARQLARLREASQELALAVQKNLVSSSVLAPERAPSPPAARDVGMVVGAFISDTSSEASTQLVPAVVEAQIHDEMLHPSPPPPLPPQSVDAGASSKPEPEVRPERRKTTGMSFPSPRRQRSKARERRHTTSVVPPVAPSEVLPDVCPKRTLSDVAVTSAEPAPSTSAQGSVSVSGSILTNLSSKISQGYSKVMASKVMASNLLRRDGSKEKPQRTRSRRLSLLRSQSVQSGTESSKSAQQQPPLVVQMSLPEISMTPPVTPKPEHPDPLPYQDTLDDDGEEPTAPAGEEELSCMFPTIGELRRSSSGQPPFEEGGSPPADEEPRSRRGSSSLASTFTSESEVFADVQEPSPQSRRHPQAPKLAETGWCEDSFESEPFGDSREVQEAALQERRDRRQVRQRKRAADSRWSEDSFGSISSEEVQPSEDSELSVLENRRGDRVDFGRVRFSSQPSDETGEPSQDDPYQTELDYEDSREQDRERRDEEEDDLYYRQDSASTEPAHSPERSAPEASQRAVTGGVGAVEGAVEVAGAVAPRGDGDPSKASEGVPGDVAGGSGPVSVVSAEQSEAEVKAAAAPPSERRAGALLLSRLGSSSQDQGDGTAGAAGGAKGKWIALVDPSSCIFGDEKTEELKS